MRKIWTSGTHIHQEINGESQRVRIAIEHLSSEIPSIGGPHDIWIHSSDYEKLQEQNKIMRQALCDFRDNGTKHDINPTGQFKKCGCFDSFKSDNWQSYIRSQDSSVKDRAREALAKVEE